MRAFLFPGQGSQETGMAADLFRADESFRRLIQHASRCAGTELERLCLRGPERELANPANLQPLLVAVSLGYLGQLTARGLLPDAVLGHSLGEISALAAAGVVAADEAVAIAAQRGRCMGQAATPLAGGMVAVITSERQRTLQVLSPDLDAGHFVLANDNAPQQLVFSGAIAALTELRQRVAREKLGACRSLSVAGPWHSPFMQTAQAKFAAWLNQVSFGSPRVPLIMNVSAALENNPGRIRELLIRNLTEPVQWRASLERLKELRPQCLLEVGPGRVLSGLARANGFGEAVRCVNVSNLRGVALAVE